MMLVTTNDQGLIGNLRRFLCGYNARRVKRLHCAVGNLATASMLPLSSEGVEVRKKEHHLKFFKNFI
jgi:hypothetical protein